MHTDKIMSEIALGKKKADLVLKNCKIINVFTHEIEQGDIAIANGLIIGIGKYSGEKERDMSGKYIAPGFIDGHVHIESSMLSPAEFSKLVIPKGTTRVIADAHEIGNVLGIKGVGFMLKSSINSPLKVHFMIPSCVPTTPFETAGASIDAQDIYFIHERENILGLGEVMDYPSVINADERVLGKIKVMEDHVIDGHAPHVSGKDLNAYILRNIKTDHECTNVEELNEKTRKGMYIHLREGSAAKDVAPLAKGVTDKNSHRLMFCTDDKHTSDILEEGHINFNINKAIKHGVDPITAIQMATINIANCYKLDRIAGIAPGYVADLVAFDGLKNIQPCLTIVDGEIVFENDKVLFSTTELEQLHVLDSIKVNISDVKLELPLESNKVRVIQFIENNIITNEVHRKVNIKDGLYINNPEDDILKVAIIERHHYTKNVGLALLEGYGLKNGAIAMSISHDSHNIICVGDNDNDMLLAVKELKKIQGGIVIASNKTILDSLELEIAGLMTNKEYKTVVSKLNEMEKHARKLGVKTSIDDPFISLAFMSLPVIPSLKVTDKGLFDVTTFKPVPLEVKE